MEQGSNNVNAKMVPGAVLILLGLLFLLGGIGLFNVFGRLIGAALFGGLAYYVYQQGKRQDNQVMQLAALPLAGLALASIFPSFVGGGLFLAAIGLAFALVWRNDPNRWWAVIVAGTLGSLALASTLSGPLDAFSGTAFLLGMAATFFALTRLVVKPQAWAIYPAGVLAVLAVADLLGGKNSGNWFVPLFLIAGGLYLFYRNGMLGALGRPRGEGPSPEPRPAATPTPGTDVAAPGAPGSGVAAPPAPGHGVEPRPTPGHDTEPPSTPGHDTEPPSTPGSDAEPR